MRSTSRWLLLPLLPLLVLTALGPWLVVGARAGVARGPAPVRAPAGCSEAIAVVELVAAPVPSVLTADTGALRLRFPPLAAAQFAPPLQLVVLDTNALDCRGIV